MAKLFTSAANQGEREMPESRLHTTESECQYLNKIGKTSETTRNYYPRIMLERYLSAAAYRADWGSMDKAMVLAHARKLMKGL